VVLGRVHLFHRIKPLHEGRAIGQFWIYDDCQTMDIALGEPYTSMLICADEKTSPKIEGAASFGQDLRPPPFLERSSEPYFEHTPFSLVVEFDVFHSYTSTKLLSSLDQLR
jgi:hypothetical protein